MFIIKTLIMSKAISLIGNGDSTYLGVIADKFTRSRTYAGKLYHLTDFLRRYADTVSSADAFQMERLAHEANDVVLSLTATGRVGEDVPLNGTADWREQLSNFYYVARGCEPSTPLVGVLELYALSWSKPDLKKLSDRQIVVLGCVQSALIPHLLKFGTSREAVDYADSSFASTMAGISQWLSDRFNC
jgi:hypothetical protein